MTLGTLFLPITFFYLQCFAQCSPRSTRQITEQLYGPLPEAPMFCRVKLCVTEPTALWPTCCPKVLCMNVVLRLLTLHLLDLDPWQLNMCILPAP